MILIFRHTGLVQKTKMCKMLIVFLLTILLLLPIQCSFSNFALFCIPKACSQNINTHIFPDTFSYLIVHRDQEPQRLKEFVSYRADISERVARASSAGHWRLAAAVSKRLECQCPIELFAHGTGYPSLSAEAPPAHSKEM